MRNETQTQEISQLKSKIDRLKRNGETYANLPPTPVIKKDSMAQTADVLRKNSTSQTDLDEDLTVTSANFLVKTKIDEGASSIDSGLPADDQITRFLNDAVSEQSNMLKYRLDEAIKTVEAERSAKQTRMGDLESAQLENARLEVEVDELRMALDDAKRESAVAKNAGSDEIKTLRMQLEEAVGKKIGLEQVIGHQREEIERLQSENAEEWGRRERSETERQMAEREIKTLKNHLEEAKDRTRRLSAHAKEHASSELSRLQAQSEASSRELAELRHAHTKLRKSHTEKAEESAHFRRRGDASEKEVKSLRSRVDDLKAQIGRVEDENDERANEVRRLQRTNEELLGQAEAYEVQIEHLTSRLRAMPSQAEQLLLGHHRRQSRILAPYGQQQHEQQEQNLSSSEESLPVFDETIDDDLETDV